MTTTIIWTIAIISGLGLLLALTLYLVAQRFKVEEGPRIELVEKAMKVSTGLKVHVYEIINEFSL